MLRLVVRIVGFLALASGMAVGVFDGARAIADGLAPLTSVGAALMTISPRHFSMIEPGVARFLHPALWDPVLVSLLMLPAVFVLFLTGTLLLLISRSPHDRLSGSV
jgi:hypothetical protein